MLPELSTLLVFVVACAALVITPGPAVVYIVARSVEQGRMAGLVSTAGISAGTLVHVAATSLGVSVFLTRSDWAFNLIKYLGVAYLILLGVQRFSSYQNEPSKKVFSKQPYAQIFWQGVLVNLLNPKTALFFLSFLPQFIDVRKGHVALQVMFLGGVLVCMGFVSDGTYALLAGSIGNALQTKPRLLQHMRYMTGFVYIALGLTAAFWQL